MAAGLVGAARTIIAGEIVPELRPHLDLEPGSRFVFAPDYLDVWFDPSLLEV